MESLTKFRLLAVRIAMAVTLLTAIAVYPLFGRVASVGLLLGGLAGILVFWVEARRVEKVAQQGSNAVYSRSLPWRLIGLVVYVVVLARGYTLDREGLTGLVGVAFGLFIIRCAVVVLGVTGLDLPREDD